MWASLHLRDTYLHRKLTPHFKNVRCCARAAPARWRQHGAASCAGARMVAGVTDANLSNKWGGVHRRQISQRVWLCCRLGGEEASAGPDLDEQYVRVPSPGPLLQHARRAPTCPTSQTGLAQGAGGGLERSGWGSMPDAQLRVKGLGPQPETSSL